MYMYMRIILETVIHLYLLFIYEITNIYRVVLKYEKSLKHAARYEKDKSHKTHVISIVQNCCCIRPFGKRPL